MSRYGDATDWRRKQGGVDWADVFEWTDSIRDSYGLWVSFVVAPPLPSARKSVKATVTLVATRYLLAGKQTEDRMYRTVSRMRGADVADVALQMAALYEQRLGEQVYEAERAAVEQGQLL